MTTAHYDELVARLRGLLTSEQSVFSSDQSAEVDALLDHGELGEALRALAWLIVEDDMQVPTAVVLEIESLAARMRTAGQPPPTWANAAREPLAPVGQKRAPRDFVRTICVPLDGQG